MGKYNTEQLFPELDMDYGHYKKWFIHLEPIEGLSPSEIFNRDDTVAEIRIIEFHDDATNKAYVDAATGGVIAMSLTQYQYGMNDSCEWVRNGKYWLTQGGTVPPCLTSAPISCSVGRAVQCTRVTYSYYCGWGGESITCGTAGTWSSDLGPEGTPSGCGSAYWPSGYRCWELE